MPARSQKQLRLAYAVSHGKSDEMPLKVARELIAATPKTKKLPIRAIRKR